VFDANGMKAPYSLTSPLAASHGDLASVVKHGATVRVEGLKSPMGVMEYFSPEVNVGQGRSRGLTCQILGSACFLHPNVWEMLGSWGDGKEVVMVWRYDVGEKEAWKSIPRASAGDAWDVYRVEMHWLDAGCFVYRWCFRPSFRLRNILLVEQQGISRTFADLPDIISR
jgi:hypothetical protein